MITRAAKSLLVMEIPAAAPDVEYDHIEAEYDPIIIDEECDPTETEQECDPTVSITASLQIMKINEQISDAPSDVWSPAEPIATAKLRSMFDSMQARLTAVASAEEIAFLLRTFDLNITSQTLVKRPKRRSFLKKGTSRTSASPKKMVSKGPGSAVKCSGPAPVGSPRSARKKILPSSPSNKRDMRLATDDEMITNTSFIMSPPQTPGTPSRGAARNNMGSFTTAKKHRQPAASSTHVYGAATPSRVTRHSSISSTIGMGGIGGVGGTQKTPRASPKASSLGSAVKTGSIASNSSNISNATRGIPRMQVVSRTTTTSDKSESSQSNLSKNLFGSSKLPRPPPVASRYAQTAVSTTASSSLNTSVSSLEAAPIGGKRNSNNSTNSAKKPTATAIARVPTSSDMRLVSAVTVERPMSVPVRKPPVAATAIPVNFDTSKTQFMSAADIGSSSSSSKPRPQSQRTPKRATPPPPVPVPTPVVVPPSPSKASNPNKGMVSNKGEIGKLFGLVGFKKTDGPQSHVISGPTTSSVPRTDIDAVQLDRTMKDALQRSAAAKATLKAAEIAAENARSAAAAAHAEAVAAARAIVREAEGGTPTSSSNMSSIKKSASTHSTHSTYTTNTAYTAPATVAMTPAAQLSSVVKKVRDNDLWAKGGTGADDVSPKREAENPFKGMF